MKAPSTVVSNIVNGNFVKSLEAFVNEVKKTRGNNSQGKPMVPGFKLIDTVKGTVNSAQALFAQCDHKAAAERLESAWTGLRKTRAAYIRDGLTKRLMDLFTGLRDRCIPRAWTDLYRPSEKLVLDYCRYVNGENFDYEAASTMYWAAVDSLTEANKAFDERVSGQSHRDIQVLGMHAIGQPVGQRELDRARRREAARAQELAKVGELVASIE